MNNIKKDSIIAEAFAMLGNEKQIQEYADIIFKLTGLVIDFISAEGETLRISHMVNFNPYCKMLRSCEKGMKACLQCDIFNASNAAAEKKAVCYSCYAGILHLIFLQKLHTNLNI